MLGHSNASFAMPGPPPEERPEARLEKRLDDLGRQVDQLRRALEQKSWGPAA